MYTVAVKGWQHFRKVGEEFLLRGFFHIEAALAALFFFLNGSEDISQRHFFLIGVHSDVCQRDDTVCGKSGEAVMAGIDALHDETAIAT